MKREAIKKGLVLLFVFLLILGSQGCASFWHFASRPGRGAGAAPLPPYSGPKAHVAVTDFEVRATKATSEAGLGLRDMLVFALTGSRRFNVVERQALNTGLVITVAVTEFEPQASGGRAGLGGGGGSGSNMFGGLLGGAVNKAHVALDIRITDASTSAVLGAKTVQGQASDASIGLMERFFGGWALAQGLSAYANTPMDKAIRICIVEAVRYVSEAVPENYYK